MQIAKILICFILLVSISGCALFIKDGEPNGYNTEKFSSVDSSSYLILKSFAKENNKEPFPAFYHINKIIIPEVKQEYFVEVMPGNFQVEAGFIGKKWIETKKFKIEKGDSIILKFYLENDLQSLH